MDQAIQECKDIIDYFNSTLRIGEKAREFVKVDRIVQYNKPPTYNDLDDGGEDDDYDD